MDSPKSAEALTSHQQALMAAVGQLLAPLARLCLAKGLSIQNVEELVRMAFVEAATQACEGLNPNRLTSRISTMTGLTRREVDRIRSRETALVTAVRSVAVEVLTRWVSDQRYQCIDGSPLAIARSGEAPSFDALAESVTTDVHPRSVLAEMERLGLARVEPDGRIRLLESVFVPSQDWARMVAFMGENVGDHLQSAVDNLLGNGHQHFEQAILADEMSSESIERAKTLISAQWHTLMTQLVPELQKLIDRDRETGQTPDRQLRVGLYSFTSAMRNPDR